jgi:hypothetical protein
MKFAKRVPVFDRSESSRFVALRPEYVEAGGGACEGLLLAVFEFWTGVRLKAGDESLWVYRTVEELQQDLYEAFGRDAIRSALERLISRGLLRRRRNPGKGWDRTYQYALNIDQLAFECGLKSQSWISDIARLDIRPSKVGIPTSNTEEPEEPKKTFSQRVEVSSSWATPEWRNAGGAE